MKRARGFTIVEVALVMTLTLILMTLMTAFLIRGQRYAAETETYSSVQRSANALLRKMTDDIYRSSSEQIKVASDGVIFLSFGPTDDVQPELELDPTGKILWKKWVGYYHDVTQETIYRGELPLDDTLSDVAVPAAPAVDLVTFRTEPSVVRRPLPGKVCAFSVTQFGDDRIRFSLSTRGMAPITAHTDAQREVEISVQTEVSLLN